MEALKVPLGLDESGTLVSAENAQRDACYVCPSCAIRLILKSGEIKAKHFAHLPNANCSLESILHKTAKRLIKQTIDDNAAGKVTISLKNLCSNCEEECIADIPVQTFSRAEEEVRIANFVCDVVGYRNTDIVLGIEILVTHAVDEKKAVDLPVYWIEVSAEELIANPHFWNPIQGRLKPAYCQKCKNHMLHVQQVADRWKIDRSSYSFRRDPRVATYIASTMMCYRCKNEIPVFWWEGVPYCKDEPPHPKPITIKYRYSKTKGESYWANTCPKCSSLQGDTFLYYGDGAFGSYFRLSLRCP